MDLFCCTISERKARKHHEEKSKEQKPNVTITGPGRMASIVGAMVQQRNALGLTQRELAARCGMPQSSIARIESGKTAPNLDTLLKVMSTLGLKLSVSASEPPKATA